MKFKYFMSLIAMGITSAATMAAPVVGQQMTAELGSGSGSGFSSYSSQTFTVGAGQEIGGGNLLLGVYDDNGFVDVSENSIVMSGLNVGFGQDSSFLGYRFSDTSGLINSFSGVSWNAAGTTISGFSASRLSFTDDTIMINMQGLTAVGTLAVNFTTAAVPEPATYAMMGLGLVLLAGVARKRAA